MKQRARNLTDAVDGFLLKRRYIVMDRDPLFCHSFRDMLKNSGVKPVRLPSRSPNLNACAERWIGSVRRECLSRVNPLGERHLRQIVSEFAAHYHSERNHQGLGNKLIAPMNDNAANSGRIVRRSGWVARSTTTIARLREHRSSGGTERVTEHRDAPLEVSDADVVRWRPALFVELVYGAGATTDPTQRGLPRHTELKKRSGLPERMTSYRMRRFMLQAPEIGNEIGSLFAEF